MIVNNERALAHIEKVISVKSIEGADNIEMIQVLGWQLISKKGEFKKNDLCVYIEIDSQVPDTDERFAFLAKKHWKVKTMKLGKFNVISQGLALPVNIFTEIKEPKIGDNVTALLGIKKIETDEERRLNKDEKWSKDIISAKKFAYAYRKHKKFFSTKIGKKFKNSKFWRKFFAWLWGVEAEKDHSFPAWIRRTDEERIENLPQYWGIDDLIATEKIDGTSTTFALRYKNKKHKKYEIYVCSRNTRQSVLDIDDETNAYWQMFKKYNIESVLKDLAKRFDVDAVILQGETYGAKLQGNPYKLDDVRFAAYNLIFCNKINQIKCSAEIDYVRDESQRASFFMQDDLLEYRYNSSAAEKLLDSYNIPHVPILKETCKLPESIEEIKKESTAKSRINSSVLREGIVYRANSDANISFKNVSKEYLLKKHE